MGGGATHTDGVPVLPFTDPLGVALHEKSAQARGGVIAGKAGSDQVAVGHPGGATEGFHAVEQVAALDLGGGSTDGNGGFFGLFRLAGEIGQPAAAAAHCGEHLLGEGAHLGRLFLCEQPLFQGLQRQQAAGCRAAVEKERQGRGGTGGAQGEGRGAKIAQAAAQAAIGLGDDQPQQPGLAEGFHMRDMELAPGVHLGGHFPQRRQHRFHFPRPVDFRRRHVLDQELARQFTHIAVLSLPARNPATAHVHLVIRPRQSTGRAGQQPPQRRSWR